MNHVWGGQVVSGGVFVVEEIAWEPDQTSPPLHCDVLFTAPEANNVMSPYRTPLRWLAGAYFVVFAPFDTLSI